MLFLLCSLAELESQSQAVTGMLELQQGGLHHSLDLLQGLQQPLPKHLLLQQQQQPQGPGKDDSLLYQVNDILIVLIIRNVYCIQ